MPLKVLLADGNTIAQNMGKKILAAAGCDVVTVSNGIAAMKKIAEVRPDVVLLDVYLAGHSGAEVCTKMKAIAETAKVPVLLTVGQMEPFGAGEAIKVKADGLIVKPFEVKNLITVVGKLAKGLGLAEPVLMAESQASKRVAAAAPEQRPPETSVAEAAVHPQPASSPQSGEACDVCGHVNREDALVCQQCDVPLPKSVMVVQASGERLLS